METTEEGGWRPRRDAVIHRWPARSNIGPYTVGPKARDSCLGLVHLVTHPDEPSVLELEHYTSLQPYLRDDLEGKLMLDLAGVTSLEHRHLGAVLGLGLLDGAPYVVRPHVPGRTLDDVLGGGGLDGPAALGLLYSVAEALSYLAESGAAPGACAMGGFEWSDIWLGFDGRVLLNGVGLRRARKPSRGALEEDFATLRRLGDTLCPGGVSGLEATDAHAYMMNLRRASPDACGFRAQNLGRVLRERFADAIPTERADLGLSTLH